MRRCLELPIDKPLGLYYLSLILTVALLLFAQNLVASRVGRAFVAVRDGEVAAQSLGVDLLRYKALAFGISGFYAGIAGGLYSAMLNFVAPEGLRAFKGLQEIVFGALLVGFVLFMRGGLVSVLKRHVRGWEEPLRLEQPAASTRTAPVEAPAGMAER